MMIHVKPRSQTSSGMISTDVFGCGFVLREVRIMKPFRRHDRSPGYVSSACAAGSDPAAPRTSATDLMAQHIGRGNLSALRDK